MKKKEKKKDESTSKFLKNLALTNLIFYILCIILLFIGSKDPTTPSLTEQISMTLFLGFPLILGLIFSLILYKKSANWNIILVFILNFLSLFYLFIFSLANLDSGAPQGIDYFKIFTILGFLMDFGLIITSIIYFSKKI